MSELPAPLHSLEAMVHEHQPSIGESAASLCLPGWIVKFCRAFERGEGMTLSHAAVSGIGHTLIAARARNFKNAKAMGREHDDSRKASQATDGKLDPQYHRLLAAIKAHRDAYCDPEMLGPHELREANRRLWATIEEAKEEANV